MLPLSTAAMTIIFLPCLSAANGLGLRWGSGGWTDEGKRKDRIRRVMVGFGCGGGAMVRWVACIEVGVEGEGEGEVEVEGSVAETVVGVGFPP